MGDSINNIPVKPGVWVDLYAASGLAVGSAIDMFEVSGGIIIVHFGASAPPGGDFGYRTLNGAGDDLQGGEGSSGAWMYSDYVGVVNVRPLASSAPKVDLGRAIISVSQSGNQLTFTHGDGAKHVIQIASGAPSHGLSGITKQISDLETKMQSAGADIAALKASNKEVAHRVDTLSSVYTYKGNSVPASIPDGKEAYFVNVFKPSQGDDITLPSGNNNGEVFSLNNQGAEMITLRAGSGESVENATHIDVPPQSFLLLVKDGNNWHRVYAGYIPTGLDDLTNRIASSLKDQLHTKTQITDMINQWLANPATHSEIDQILTSLGYEKKAQPTPNPGDVRVYIGKGDDYPAALAGGGYSPHQDLVVQGMDSQPSKVWIAVPESISSKVTGIIADGGLAAVWDNQVKTIDGKQWRVYLSPYQFHSQHIDFTLKWKI